MQSCHVPKLIGADAELANLILGVESPDGSGHLAARLLLEAIHGLPAGQITYAYPSHSFPVAEWGRKFLASNGSSFYIDAHHLEANTPECLGPRDYVAAWHAMLRLAEQARIAANRRLRVGHSIEVLANTSDRKSHSFGSHLNIALTRKAWTSLFEGSRLLWLSSYHVSSILFAGAGKVGSENGKPWAPFQLAERADFFSQLTTLDTTIPNRGVVNQRDESLAGRNQNLARYHCIFHESNLQEIAAYLKAGVLSLVLLMLEAGEVDLAAAFEDPVTALPVISRDQTFVATFPSTGKKRLSAIDVQSMFLERATRFVEAGRYEGLLADAPHIIALWGETLDLLKKKDLRALSRRLDWALKLSLLTQLKAKHPTLNWESPEIRYADLQYANIDPKRGLFWAYQEAGLVERVVTEERIEYLRCNPPENTRAYLRAMLLRRAEPGDVSEIKWDGIRFKPNGHGRNRRVDMGDPFGMTKEVCGHMFADNPTLEEALDSIEQHEREEMTA